MFEVIKEKTAISMWVSLLGCYWHWLNTPTGALSTLAVAALVANIICHVGGVF